MRVVAVSPAESFREAEVQPHLVLRALHEFDEQHARALWASAATTGAD
jgi:hypothetical protein